MILSNTTVLYIPLENLVPASVYSVSLTVSNSKGTISQTITIDTSLMLTIGAIALNPNTDIKSGSQSI